MAVTQEEVISALKECYDPEIPVNIVDLGLIYEVRVKPTEVANLTGDDIEVEMTLTAQGCPSQGSISEDVKQRLLRIRRGQCHGQHRMVSPVDAGTAQPRGA